MPIPNRKPDESKQDFISRCMENETMNKEYKDNGQRYAVCIQQSKSSILSCVCDAVYLNSYGSEEMVDFSVGMYVPNTTDYIEILDEPLEEYNFDVMANKEQKQELYVYMDPITREFYLYNKRGVYTKNGRMLMPVSTASEYQGRKVNLNKPFRTPGGPKKFSVYVKNEKGNIVKVNFGDPNMKIKKNIPERRRSFRARHNCDNPGPKWKARYWSCKAW